MSDSAKRATLTVRAALESDSQYGAVVPPIHLSSTYTFAGFGNRREYDYGRSGNPTRDALANALAELEGGAGAVVTSSGMSAVDLLCQFLEAGDLLIAPHDCYGGTYRLFDALSKRGKLEVAFIDQADDKSWHQALKRQPKMIWVETPSNPLLRVTDIREVSGWAKECRALLVVDNTFLSPVWQQPIGLGADLVVHSTTKYLNGHSDVVGGAVIAATGDLHRELCWWANCIGVTGAPFDSYLTLRGLRTLHARMPVHGANAMAIAQFLSSHRAVRKVYYPGLESHSQHRIAKEQQRGFGAIVSFELHGSVEHVRRVVERLKYFSLAESLGGVESLIAHPATMTHAAMSPEARERAGLVDSLLRISVGIESADDLISDLKSALDGL